MKTRLPALLFCLLVCFSAAAQTTPTADEIVDKYVAAIGGKKALTKLKDLTLQGSITINNMPMQQTVKQKLSGKSSLLITSNGQVFYKQVTDGENVLMVTPQGTMRPVGAAAKQVVLFSRLVSERSYKEDGIKSTLEGKEVIDGRDAYKITHTLADGSSSWTNYYDVATGLLVQNVSTMASTGMATYKFSEYKEIPGTNVKIAHTVNSQAAGVKSQFVVSSALANKGIDDTEFRVQ